MPVTQDATSGQYFPADAAEFAELLANTDLPVPNFAIWPMQDASGNLLDTSGNGNHLVAGGSGATYLEALAGYSRGFVKLTDNSSAKFGITAPTPNTESFLAILFVAVHGTPAAGRSIFEHPQHFLELNSTPAFQSDANTIVVGSTVPGTTVHIVVLQNNIAAGVERVYIDGKETLKPGFYNSATSGSLGLGAVSGANGAAPIYSGYGVAWTGTDAERSPGEIAALIDFFSTGPLALADVDKDATSTRYVPGNAAQWAVLLQGSGIKPPVHAYGFQEASTPIVDLIGGVNLVPEGARQDFQQAVAGWGRYGALSRGDSFFSTDAALPNIGPTSQTIFGWAIIDAIPSSDVALFIIGGAVDFGGINATTGYLEVRNANGDLSVGGTAGDLTGVVRPWILQTNVATGKVVFKTDVETITVDRLSESGSGLYFSGGLVGDGAVCFLYGSEWDDTDAELSLADLDVLLARVSPSGTNGAIMRRRHHRRL